MFAVIALVIKLTGCLSTQFAVRQQYGEECITHIDV